MSLDPYDVLGVSREASVEVLKAAYRRLVRDHHPDVASDKIAATARMASINQAWQTVGDPQKRAAFDARQRLDALETERQRGAAQRNAASREATEAASSERARLEAQRLARLEREKIERERARRLRTVAKTTKSTAKTAGKTTTAKTAPSQAAAPTSTAQSATKSGGGSGGAGAKTEASPRTGAREARLRQKLVLAAQLFHRERKVEEAVALCRSVLLADGRSVAARELLGDIYLQQGRAEYALMMFDQALLIEPNHLMLRRKRDQLQNAQENGRPHLSRIASPPMPRSLLGRLRNRLSIKK